jgi:hypothetical protein
MYFVSAYIGAILKIGESILINYEFISFNNYDLIRPIIKYM